MGQCWPSTWCCKFRFYCSHTYSFTYCRWPLSSHNNWAIVRETVWSGNHKIFMAWPCTENYFDNPCPKMIDIEDAWSVSQSFPTLLKSMDCSLLGTSIHGLLQARTLEWVAISSSRGSSWLRVIEDRRNLYLSYSLGRATPLHYTVSNSILK